MCNVCRSPLSQALGLMSANGISGLPVLDERGLLSDILADSDILALTDFSLDIDVATALGQVCALGGLLPVYVRANPGGTTVFMYMHASWRVRERVRTFCFCVDVCKLASFSPTR